MLAGLTRWMDSLFNSMLFPMTQFTQNLKTCLLVLLLIVALSTQSAAQPARVLRAGPPRPTVLPGFQLAVQVYGGDTSDFEVLEADLDGDGRSEMIFANRDIVSNGLGASFWTIYVFPNSEFRRLLAPLIFSVQEYGALGTFVPEGNSVLILTTRWLWSKDPQGRRGGGLYLVGQWWRYRSGELAPVLERPLLARRFLASFATERGRTFSDQRAPYLWLKGRGVEVLKENPLSGTQEKEVKRGILQSVSATPFTESETNAEIVFKPEHGRPLTLEYSADNSQGGVGALEHIGDAVSGRIYPDRYFPAMREKWLRGKQARLVTYGKGAQFEGLKVLWLDRPVEAR